jgi:four helix bundle protein
MAFFVYLWICGFVDLFICGFVYLWIWLFVDWVYLCLCFWGFSIFLHASIHPNMRQYSFERLEVWQLSRSMVKVIYKITGQWPVDERFGLVSQARRSALSVPTNLSEGSSRTSGKEQARFTEMAFGSLMEVLNLLILAHDLDFLSLEDLNEIRPSIEEIGNKLNNLKNPQINKSPNKQIHK